MNADAVTIKYFSLYIINNTENIYRSTGAVHTEHTIKSTLAALRLF